MNLVGFPVLFLIECTARRVLRNAEGDDIHTLYYFYNNAKIKQLKQK